MKGRRATPPWDRPRCIKIFADVVDTSVGPSLVQEGEFDRRMARQFAAVHATRTGTRNHAA
jgi:hypothetical protein